MRRLIHLLSMIFTVALLSATVGACGSGDDSSSSTTDHSTTTSVDATSTTGSVATQEVRAYFLREEKVGPVAREATGAAVAKSALEGLLAGPTDTEQQLGFTSAIPTGTTLLGVTIAGGTATVNLSSAFESGGGSASMMGRVAQVVFTLTQFPTVAAVAFQLEGTPVTALGGEGLILDHPQTRADWEGLTPAILVESPLPFAEVASPLHIVGNANTFEAAFRVNVTDGDGLIVYDQPAMATSGTGTRGTFDVTATFDVPRSGVGSVIVFEDSAKDGTPIHVVEIPIRVSG